jgi:hypothetical protein
MICLPRSVAANSGEDEAAFALSSEPPFRWQSAAPTSPPCSSRVPRRARYRRLWREQLRTRQFVAILAHRAFRHPPKLDRKPSLTSTVRDEFEQCVCDHSRLAALLNVPLCRRCSRPDPLGGRSLPTIWRADHSCRCRTGASRCCAGRHAITTRRAE